MTGDDDELNYCSGRLENNIIWSLAPPASPLLGAYRATPAYCCIRQGGGGGTGNLTADPPLADPHNGDFHLLPTSPCIDAGGQQYGMSTNMEGHPRIVRGAAERRGDGSLIDIGPDGVDPPKNAVERAHWALYE